MEYAAFLIDFILHVDRHLEAFVRDHGPWVYALLFLIVFVETGLVVMPFLPGDSLLFSVGLLAAASGELSLGTVIPLLIGAALLGDQVNYFIGKYFSGIIREREKVLFLKRAHIEETEAFYAKYGPKTVILARFIPIVRTVAPFVAGAGRMSYPVYLLYGFLGATLWLFSSTKMSFL